jgi:WD40 repeat protein
MTLLQKTQRWWIIGGGIIVVGVICFCLSFLGDERPRTLYRHAGIVTNVAISADGRRILSSSSDLSVRLWNISTGTLEAEFHNHSLNVFQVAFSPNGEYAISGGQDSKACIWDLKRLRLDGEYVLTYHNVAVAWMPSEPEFVTAGFQTIQIWDMSTHAQVRKLEGDSYDADTVDVTSDGKWLLTTSVHFGNRSDVRVIDADTGNCIRSFGFRGRTWGADMSSDKKYVVTGTDGGEILLWDMSTGDKIPRFPKGPGVNGILFSRDACFVVSGHMDNSIRLWDFATGKVLRRGVLSRSSQDYVTAVAISQDNRLIVAGSSDGGVYVWDLKK